MAKKIKDELEELVNEEDVVEVDKYLSTGSYLLNLALSGSIDGGWGLGQIHNPAGYSSAGKTMLGLTALAEAANNSAFDEYRLILFDSENGALSKFFSLFGNKLHYRIEHIISNSMEKYYALILQMEKNKEKFILIVDSSDGLICNQDYDRQDEIIKAVEQGKEKEIKMAQYPLKAKFYHEIGRNTAAAVSSNGGVVFYISQAKDKIDATMFQKKETKAGGSSLTYYSHSCIWLKKIKTIKKTVKGKAYNVGAWIKFTVEKVRDTGKSRDVDIYIDSYVGIDDIRTNLKYLEDNNAIEKTGRSYVISEWDFKGTEETLFKYIEENNKQYEFAKLVENTWNEIEETLNPGRQSKYA